MGTHRVLDAMTVYDYSWSRPDPAALDEGVIRYLCTGSQRGKRLEADELARLHAAGKPVGLVFENTADASTWDGAEALRLRAALGFPDHRPIYFAQDQNVTEDGYQRIADLLHATGVPVGQRGLYAGAPLVQWCLDSGAATWGWIASALSWSMAPPYSADRAIAMAPGAHLIQLVGTDVPGTDMNTVLKPDWGGWHPDDQIHGTGGSTPVVVALPGTTTGGIVLDYKDSSITVDPHGVAWITAKGANHEGYLFHWDGKTWFQQDLGGALLGSPAVAFNPTDPGRIDFSGVGIDSKLYHAYLKSNGEFHPWELVGGNVG